MSAVVKTCPLCGDEMPTSWRWVTCRGCHKKYSFRAAGQDKYEDGAYREALAAQQAKLDGGR